MFLCLLRLCSTISHVSAHHLYAVSRHSRVSVLSAQQSPRTKTHLYGHQARGHAWACLCAHLCMCVPRGTGLQSHGKPQTPARCHLVWPGPWRLWPPAFTETPSPAQGDDSEGPGCTVDNLQCSSFWETLRQALCTDTLFPCRRQWKKTWLW